MKKSKGFTLIELIVAIAIMGIILLLAFPMMRGIQSSNQDKKFTAYKDSMESSAKLYTDSYQEDMFGYHSSGCFDVSYQDMKKKNLLKSFKYQDITCEDESSFVRVRKSGERYFYESSLLCKSNGKEVYKSVVESSEICDGAHPDNDPPEISFEVMGVGQANGTIKVESGGNIYYWVNASTSSSNQKVKIIINDAYGLRANAEATYQWFKSDGTAVADAKLIKFKNDEAATVTSYKVNIPNSDQMYYKLVVTPVENKIVDLNGNRIINSRTLENVGVDIGYPSCSISYASTVNPQKSSETGWYHAPTVNVTLTRNDTLSGVESYIMQPSLPLLATQDYNNVATDSITTIETERKYYGRVRDVAHNVTDCQSTEFNTTVERTATFDANDGNAPSFSTITKYYGDKLGTLPTVTRIGHQFLGWFTAASGGSEITANTTMPSTDTTYYAHWRIITYSITLSKNDATNTPTSSTTVKYGDTSLGTLTTLPERKYSVSFDKNGTEATATTTTLYSSATFNGWYTAASGGSLVASNAGTPALQASVSGYTDASKKWNKTDDTTLYAQFGTQPTVSIPAISKTGYNCSWNTKNNGSGTAVSGNYRPSGNVTLYAICTAKTVKVTFDCNGGTGGGEQIFTYDVANQKFNKSCTRAGYSQLGWAASSTATAQSWSTSSGVSNSWINTNSPSITVYAVWNLDPYTVTLNKNDATNTPTSSTTVKYGDTSLGTLTTLPERKYSVSFDKNGTGATATTTTLYSSATFNGWYTAASGGFLVASNVGTPALQASVSGYTDASKKWNKTGGATLYAQFGTQPTVSIPAISKTGYNCSWNTKNDGSGTAVSGNYSPSGNVTLYAICKVKKVKVTFDCNGGKIKDTNNTTAEQTFTYDVADQKFNNSCTRTGYSQLGWAASSTATAQSWSTSSSVSNNWINTNSPSITVYAVWQEHTINLSFHSNGAPINSDVSSTYTLTSNHVLKKKSNDQTTFYGTKYSAQYTSNKLQTPAHFFNSNGHSATYWVIQNHTTKQCPDYCTIAGEKADVRKLANKAGCVFNSSNNYTCTVMLCAGWE